MDDFVDSVGLQELAAGVSCIVVAMWILKKAQIRARRAELRDAASRAVDARDQKVHSVLANRGLHPDTDPTLGVREVHNQVRRGKLDARAHVSTLAKRAARYGRRDCVNAITEEFYDEAYSAAGGSSTSDEPLAGVPISVKDCIGQKGAFADRRNGRPDV